MSFSGSGGSDEARSASTVAGATPPQSDCRILAFRCKGLPGSVHLAVAVLTLRSSDAVASGGLELDDISFLTAGVYLFVELVMRISCVSPEGLAEDVLLVWGFLVLREWLTRSARGLLSVGRVRFSGAGKPSVRVLELAGEQPAFLTAVFYFFRYRFLPPIRTPYLWR